jgi:hypothetical protein
VEVGAHGGAVFEALHRIDSRWCHLEFFIDIIDPGVDSASNSNEYQEYFLEVKVVGV